MGRAVQINKLREESKTDVVRYQLTEDEKAALQDRLNTVIKQEKRFLGRKGQENKDRAAKFTQERQQIEAKLQDKRFDTNESGGSLGGSSRATPLPSAAGREGGQSMPGVDQFDPSASIQTTANKLSSIQTTPDTSGTSLAGAGKNGGVANPDVIVMASNVTDNSSTTQSSSQSNQSTIVSVAAQPTSQGNQPLSHRYGVA